MMKYLLLLVSACFLCCIHLSAQQRPQTFSKADTLAGSNTPQRAWWDVQHYAVDVTPDFSSKSIVGKTTLTYTVLQEKHNGYLQVDLQKPMLIDSLYYNGKMYINDPRMPYYNKGNHWFIPLPNAPVGSTQTLTIVYHGVPKEAVNPPWDGGWVWTKDGQGNPWMSAANEDDGASLWFPCKDVWSDEPDQGASLTIHVPDTLKAVGNGRLKASSKANGLASYTWQVQAPINAYNIIPYIGNYTAWSDTLQGEKGTLDLTYWVLRQDEEKARKQFEQVKPMLRALEYWFGPYPFYEDGYQLVQAPYLGMEHQSAVAYGNGFQNGYRGRDLSGTGWGLKWDYIIVHESGHEWFGNNLTAKDKADMWVHEGFTDYSETLFIEYYYGRQAADAYVRGLRKNIANDRPVIGPYGVNKSGSGDMYYKGANLIHTIRQLIDNDSLFRQILRGLNRDFYHQTVTSQQVEAYISQKSGKNFSKVFDQYLRTTTIPELEWKRTGNTVQYRWLNAIAGFDMPLKLTNGQWITPTVTAQKIQLSGNNSTDVTVDPNFYVRVKL